jgi:hypothetical protein
MLEEAKQETKISEESKHLFERYRSGLELVAERARNYGYTDIFAFRGSPFDSRFLKKSVLAQELAVRCIEGFNDICTSALSNNIDLKDRSWQMTWWIIRAAGFTPPSDLFSYILDGDIIEIYDADHIQIFRSFNFFSLVSYSLDEIHNYEWFELYNRDEEIMKTMIAELTNLVASGKKTLMVSPFPPHVVAEKFSPRKKANEVAFKCFSPLFKPDGSVGGYIVTFKKLNQISA